MVDNETFLTALAAGLSEEERVILCGFEGDPDGVGPTAWKPRPWKAGKACPFGRAANAYTTISSFHRARDGTWRRRGECWSGGLALMVDDLGTKLPLDTIAPAPPTALIETSPANFQAWYFMEAPIRDMGVFDALIRAFIAQRLLGADPGMSGVTRVGRLPIGTNGKRKYGGAFPVRAVEWHPDRRFSVNALLSAFGLELRGVRNPFGERLVPRTSEESAALWVHHYRWLRGRGMLKREEPDVSGWYEMTCPWVGNHSGRSDTGAAIREPASDNGWHGAFRCHHGHCADRGWAELTDWINEQTVEELERANDAEHE